MDFYLKLKTQHKQLEQMAFHKLSMDKIRCPHHGKILKFQFGETFFHKLLQIQNNRNHINHFIVIQGQIFGILNELSSK